MTDLQLGLAVIGALAVAGVLVYNRLQERSVRKHAEGAFGSTHSDVLMRREPTLEPAPRRPQVKDPALPDARVDYVIELSLPAPAPCAIVLEAWSPVEQRFARRLLLAANDGGGWRRLAHADPGTCQALRTGLQLVSRSGVVSDAELIEFRSQVETLAARMGAAVAAPEMRAALEAAHDLDRTCAEVDIQVALHVVGVPPQAGAPDQAFQTTPRDDGVTFTLDVARTLEPSRTYEAMARAGRQLAQSRGGRLVDDHGRELDERALAAIGVQLDTVRQMLAGRGIEPGSPLALRLFS